RVVAWGGRGRAFGNWRSKPWPTGMEEFVIDGECKIGPGMVVFSRPAGVPGKGRPPLGASLGVRDHTLLVKVDPFLFTLPLPTSRTHGPRRARSSSCSCLHGKRI